MMEGASHGIAAVDCFELFGFPEDAPNLRDANSPGKLLRPDLPNGLGFRQTPSGASFPLVSSIL